MTMIIAFAMHFKEDEKKTLPLADKPVESNKILYLSLYDSLENETIILKCSIKLEPAPWFRAFNIFIRLNHAFIKYRKEMP